MARVDYSNLCSWQTLKCKYYSRWKNPLTSSVGFDSLGRLKISEQDSKKWKQSLFLQGGAKKRRPGQGTRKPTANALRGVGCMCTSGYRICVNYQMRGVCPLVDARGVCIHECGVHVHWQMQGVYTLVGVGCVCNGGCRVVRAPVSPGFIFLKPDLVHLFHSADVWCTHQMH